MERGVETNVSNGPSRCLAIQTRNALSGHRDIAVDCRCLSRNSDGNELVAKLTVRSGLTRVAPDRVNLARFQLLHTHCM